MYGIEKLRQEPLGGVGSHYSRCLGSGQWTSIKSEALDNELGFKSLLCHFVFYFSEPQSFYLLNGASNRTSLPLGGDNSVRQCMQST